MALRVEYALGHSKFNEFLFSVVGTEKSGMQLTVISALARLGFDPWQEAARLAELPKESATRALMGKIATLPEGDWKVSDSQSIAIRLIDCLPRRAPFLVEARQGPSIENRKPKLVPNWLVWFALVATVLFAVSRLSLAGDFKTDVGNVQSDSAHFLGIAVN
jgi:hypothetical protein